MENQILTPDSTLENLEAGITKTTIRVQPMGESPSKKIKKEHLITFGKYKNKTIDQIIDLDPLYCQWLYTQNRYKINEIKNYIYHHLKYYIMSFGKNKGKSLGECDPTYLAWLEVKIDDELMLKHIQKILV
jgi:uncharacterized protein (DUF3820 family)